MRSYEGTVVQSLPCSISQAVRATLAIPELFPAILINDTEYVAVKPEWTNPVGLAYFEASNIWPHREIGVIISIGAGLGTKGQSDGTYPSLAFID